MPLRFWLFNPEVRNISTSLQDLDEKEEAEAAKASRVDDVEAAAARRAAEAEEWRLQQLRTGQSDENPNMQVCNVSEFQCTGLLSNLRVPRMWLSMPLADTPCSSKP